MRKNSKGNGAPHSASDLVLVTVDADTQLKAALGEFFSSFGEGESETLCHETQIPHRIGSHPSPHRRTPAADVIRTSHKTPKTPIGDSPPPKETRSARVIPATSQPGFFRRRRPKRYLIKAMSTRPTSSMQSRGVPHTPSTEINGYIVKAYGLRYDTSDVTPPPSTEI